MVECVCIPSFVRMEEKRSLGLAHKIPGPCPVAIPGESESSKLIESFCLQNLKWKEIQENTWYQPLTYTHNYRHIHDVDLPSVCYEYILLPLLNKEPASAYDRAKYNQAERIERESRQSQGDDM